MKLIDIIIIYLAGGAPLGVYYFLHNRAKQSAGILFLKTAANFIFWLPLAFVFLRRNNKTQTRSKNNFTESSTATFNIEKANLPALKQLESLLLETKTNYSVFEIREVLNRYVGLSAAVHFDDTSAQRIQNDVYQTVNHPNKNLAFTCLERRNRKRLFHHQNQARRDLLEMIFALKGEEKIALLACELFEVLNDMEAQIELSEWLEGESQTSHEQNVNESEKSLWKPEKPQPLPTNSRISSGLNTMNATMKFRAKD